MDKTQTILPDYLFEVSWETCNKVGGIYTVIKTKALTMSQQFHDKYITIGPDLNNDHYIGFEEDPNLLKDWKKLAYNEGLRLRIGRWKTQGNPIVVLVNFSSFVSEKNDILKKLWEDYKVDSISGQWDYVEPVLFGYAAGKAIENFVRNYCSASDKVIAHFHEWMTASGALYLKKAMPSVANVFTTHATVMGRCLASNGMRLYSDMDKFNVDEMAKTYNVVAKHSIEKITSANVDCFTTVSQITSTECKYMLGHEADIVTPNGFEEDIVWKGADLEEKRKTAKELFIKIAEASLGKKFEKEPLIVGTCGRYEFRNKGLDEFIDSLAMLNNDPNLDREILAYMLVPGWNNGPRKDLQEFLSSGNFIPGDYTIKNVTHYMGDSENDAILNKLRSTNLYNTSSGKVNVMFVPAYLDGSDGIFNKPYYELLPGFDITVFPSYYEPWGYTPLESIAFSVPTVTTTLAGFGKWILSHSQDHEGVTIIERNDSDSSSLREDIKNIISYYAGISAEELNVLRGKARLLSETALWKNLVQYYYNAYDKAIKAANIRAARLLYDGGENYEQINFLKQQLLQSTPTWTRIIIERQLPERLRPLEELSRNLWWSWTIGGRSLFEYIDEKLWNATERNPIALLDNLTTDRLKELEQDPEFLQRMDNIYAAYQEYMGKKKEAKGPSIAYFCMEYGLHSSLKIYSGGLGILAGDYLKEASDKNIPMVAVGLLYRYGYFTQQLSASGEQEAVYEAQNFYKLPISPVRDASGNWKSITLNYPGRKVIARIWRCDVGRTELYLLDTDHDLNLYEDRTITHYLYGGDWENRLKQEILLGLGGIKALREMGIYTDIYHCNEGHAAFTGIRRIQEFVEQEGLSFSEALEIVRSSSLFTTHTPVPAGHDSFPESMIRQYLSYMPDVLKITWEQFINLGKTKPNDPNERFSMSFLACNLSQEINGVSWLHGEVSKDILGSMWPGYFKKELHIGYVTNGVHVPTWVSTNLRDIYDRYMGKELETHYYDNSIWQRIYDVPDKELWNARVFLKKKLIDHIKNRITNPAKYHFDSPQQIVKIVESLKPETLTIGFARRFATYKRAHLLFTDLQRLEKIVNNPNYPVQFLFAGKAHPNDKLGQDLIKRIVEVSSMPQFTGKILFIQNYDMDVARRMVQGVDIWLNTPTRPLEASGTSGEKAVMNGVLHFSVLDGWWVEGYKEGAGWMLPMKRTFEDQHLQDQLDAETIYTLLEEEIIPAYYNRDEDKISHQWLGYIKKSIAEVAPQFTTKRMIEDYQNKFYNKLYERNKNLTADNYREAREIAAWKRKVSHLWDNDVYIVSNKTYDVGKEAIVTGKSYKTEVTLSLGQLSPEDVGVELIIARQINDQGDIDIIEATELTLIKTEGSLAYYELIMSPKRTGSFDVAIRVFAKNKKLPHRMDFALVKWS